MSKLLLPVWESASGVGPAIAAAVVARTLAVVAYTTAMKLLQKK